MKILFVLASGIFVLILAAPNEVEAQKRQPPVRPKAFKGQVYSSFDGRVVLTMTSPTELELTQGGVNLICKYTIQDNTVRVVVNSLGASNAVYFRITAEGLQDKNGNTFYTSSALNALRQRIEQEQRRAAARLEQSKTATKMVWESRLSAFWNSNSVWPTCSIVRTVITDVDVTFFGDVSRATGDYNSPETPRPFKLKYWFGGISSPRLSKESVSRGTPVLEMFAGPADEEPCHRANPSDYFMLRFADTETFEAFVPKLDAAITAWKARFGDVPQRAYEGIVAH